MVSPQAMLQMRSEQLEGNLQHQGGVLFAFAGWGQWFPEVFRACAGLENRAFSYSESGEESNDGEDQPRPCQRVG